MSEEILPNEGGLQPHYKKYQRQKCFIGYSEQADWSEDLLSACQEILSRPEFDLEVDYARKYFHPDIPLRQKALDLIANSRYGIYDLSYWYDKEEKQWQMPRNIFIELGMAIALNRPTLLLRYASNRQIELPHCFRSLSGQILEFSGEATLKQVLLESLPQWVKASPKRDWWNRYCIFGNRVCEYRETHPQARQWGWQTLHCHISDGSDVDRPDFRAVVEAVIERFNDVTFNYLDTVFPVEGYNFLLCSHCQSVRSSPFAIYRISPHTPAETFIAIGISLALEQQFEYKIPKILLTENKQHIPALLDGYEVVVAKSDKDRKQQLQQFLPMVMQRVRSTAWKPRPIPFVDFVYHIDLLSQTTDQRNTGRMLNYGLMGLPFDSYRRYRDVLLECTEFHTMDSLQEVFETPKLKPYQTDLPIAYNVVGRVDMTIDYLIQKRLDDGQSVFLVLLTILRDNRKESEPLHEELANLCDHIQTIVSQPTQTALNKASVTLSKFPTELYSRCRVTLSKCEELDSQEYLRAVFAMEELAPYIAALPEALEKEGRIDSTIDYLLRKRLGNGQSVFLRFLAQLYERRHEDDPLREELDNIISDIRSVIAQIPMEIAPELSEQCRTVLLQCDEFDNHALLQAVFVIAELRSYRDNLPLANNKVERVNRTIDYLLQKRFNNGQPILPLFLAVLRDRRVEGDALYDSLDSLYEVMQSITTEHRLDDQRIGEQISFIRSPQDKTIFVDRENERSLFEGMLNSNSQQRVLWIEAESGMGKSALLHMFRERCRDLMVSYVAVDFKGGGVDLGNLLQRIINGLQLGNIIEPVTQGREFDQVTAASLFEHLVGMKSLVILLFDTFEQAPTDVQKWLVTLAEMISNQDSGVRIIVATRDISSKPQGISAVSLESIPLGNWAEYATMQNMEIPLEELKALLDAFQGQSSAMVSAIHNIQRKNDTAVKKRTDRIKE